MSFVKINQKKYEVPELTFKHLPQMEKCGLSMVDMVSGKYIFTTAEVFTAIVVGCDTDHADYLLEQHILGGGDIMPVYDAFIEAMNNSGFFKKLLEEKKDAKKPKTAPAEND